MNTNDTNNTNTKRVLVFSTAYFPYVGGAEIAIKEITDRLPDIVFDLITARMSRKNSKNERIGNVTVHRVGLGIFFDKWFLPALGFLCAQKLNKKNNYYAIWSMMASQAGVAAALFKKKHKDKKLVLTLQEGDDEEHLTRYVFGSKFLYSFFIKPWHVLPMKNADIVTAISNYLKVRAVKSGVCLDKVVVIPNGVNIEYFNQQPTTNDKQRLREELGIKENEKVVITTSRLVKKNAVRDLIEAMRYLPDDIKLLIIGTGQLKKQLQLLVTNYKLQDRIFFLGHIDNNKIPSYLHISDVFVRPSLSEGMGNSFIEAMASGTPIIGTTVGGITDFLKHEKTGLFCEVSNPKSIVEQINRIIKDDTLRELIIRGAISEVEVNYQWDSIAQIMKSVFLELRVPNSSII